MRYAELHCKTNFSFLEGASHADELVARARELGYAALAVTDRESLAGVVRAHIAAKEAGPQAAHRGRSASDRCRAGRAVGHRPQILWPPVAAAHRRPPPGGERAVPADARRILRSMRRG